MTSREQDLGYALSRIAEMTVTETREDSKSLYAAVFIARKALGEEDTKGTNT